MPGKGTHATAPPVAAYPRPLFSAVRMDAMILAAGFGTRLRPLTNHTPKALVAVNGVPVLARVARRLVAAGATRLIINVAHLGAQVADYVRGHDGFGVDALVSDEPGGPYETGGGLKHAAHLFTPGRPFLVHNADILTTVDLGALYQAQAQSDALATLAVVPATTDRFLVIDDAGLAGYGVQGEARFVRPPAGTTQQVDFCGVQAGSPALLDAMQTVPDQKFSIMDVYLRLARDGAHIAVFERSEQAFLDIGTHEALAVAHAQVQKGVFA